MAFELRKILDVGVGDPIVARLGPQASDLINWLRIDEKKKLEIGNLYAVDLTHRLVECQKLVMPLNKRSLMLLQILNKGALRRLARFPTLLACKS